MLFGHGQPVDRAWLFILLARQERLDVVMLAVPDTKQPGKLRPWLPALLLDGKLYLFDSHLGLPIPGPGGEGIATLEQAAADKSVLDGLDLPREPYWVHQDDLQQVTAWVEASPGYLTRRMQLIERRMAGEQTMVLSVQATELADRLKASPHVSDVRLWAFPYEVELDQQTLSPEESQTLRYEFGPLMAGFPIAKRSAALIRQGKNPSQAVATIFKGRILHFRGAFSSADETEQTASYHYLEARIPPAEMEKIVQQVVDAAVKEAPNPESINPSQLFVAIEETMQRAKDNASIWLGLINFEVRRYDTAMDWFKNHTLAQSPDGPWTFAAEYNLGRTYEALADEALADKNTAKAKEYLELALPLYDRDTSQQRQGNLLRARRIRERLAALEAAP
jgi:tetratricopeptide (TPR) repeat protein